MTRIDLSVYGICIWDLMDIDGIYLKDDSFDEWDGMILFE
jgi:hypothetical protein